MEVLQFVFSGFWVFCGVLVLLWLLLQGLAEVVQAIRGKR